MSIARHDPPSSSAESASLSAFRREIGDLDARIVHLGALACETVPRGTEALLTGDYDLAQQIIDDHVVIDDLTVAIEDRCLAILARYAPTGVELRRAVVMMWLAQEFERSADLMTNVAKSTLRMLGTSLSPEIRGHVAAMGGEANRLLRLAVDAFADRDATLAASLRGIDDQLDQMNRDMIGVIFGAQGDDRIGLGAAVQLALIARYYERIGDHAVNIGDRVRYMVDGRTIDPSAPDRRPGRRSRPGRLQG